MTPARSLARFAVALTYDGLDENVIQSAKRHLLDTVGVGLLGSRDEMPKRALDGIIAMPQTAGPITVWGRDVCLSAPFAAMANGIAAHVLDFDDTHTAGIVHGSAILAPLVMALGEELGSSGREIIVAFVAGWEVAARVGLASKGSMHERGYHTSSVAGVFGAAAAASRLLGLGEVETTNAMALSGSQASGINEYQSNGSSSKILHIGWAAHAGIVAAYLARAGMTGPDSIYEGRLGFLNAYGDLKRCDVGALTRDLGDIWEITQISIKPYSCCHFGHAFIDCAKELKSRGVLADQIAKIECVVPAIEVPMVCEPADQKSKPTSPYAAKFSLPYMISVGLIDGEVGQATFSRESYQRADLLALASRVKYRVAAPDETTFPKYFPGWIRLRMTDGSVQEARIDINQGTPGNPMSDKALGNKFRGNLEPVYSSGRTDALYMMLGELDQCGVHDVAQLLGAED